MIDDPYPTGSVAEAEMQGRGVFRVSDEAWRRLWNFKEQQKAEIERLREDLETQRKIDLALVAEKRKLVEAVQFCRDIAAEEYDFQQANVGAELVLRHIMRKCDEGLGRG